MVKKNIFLHEKNSELDEKNIFFSEKNTEILKSTH
jgi:hypothetical protein